MRAGNSMNQEAIKPAQTMLSLAFCVSSQGWEAGAAVSSTPIEAQTLQLSDSKELDVISANAKDTEDSPTSVSCL